ncbi:hypothetical protein BKA62DRAFT_675374 [Auriculariales sp. MPI-PUGE-AT-0066]|nr:hypothetical protein BKA62DRAFT_675374 [Auriculariales sp. MPI-PUGE-AT-0066]
MATLAPRCRKSKSNAGTSEADKTSHSPNKLTTIQNVGEWSAYNSVPIETLPRYTGTSSPLPQSEPQSASRYTASQRSTQTQPNFLSSIMDQILRGGNLVIKNVLTRSGLETTDALWKSMGICIRRARSLQLNPSNLEGNWASAYNCALQLFTSRTNGFAMVSEQKSLYLLKDTDTDPGVVASHRRRTISSRRSYHMTPDIVIELIIDVDILKTFPDAPLGIVPLLGEFKRSISRKLLNRETGQLLNDVSKVHLMANLHSAVHQANNGGFIALRRAPQQDSIILLASSGDWFIWRRMLRRELPSEETEPTDVLLSNLAGEKLNDATEEADNDDDDIQFKQTHDISILLSAGRDAFLHIPDWSYPVQLDAAEGRNRVTVVLSLFLAVVHKFVLAADCLQCAESGLGSDYIKQAHDIRRYSNVVAHAEAVGDACTSCLHHRRSIMPSESSRHIRRTAIITRESEHFGLANNTSYVIGDTGESARSCQRT